MTDRPVAAEMERRLTAALAPTALSIVDDSDRHIGHAGHDGRGESHFALRITARAFEGQPRLARQRAVYAALGDLMDGRIHALSIVAKTPSEA